MENAVGIVKYRDPVCGKWISLQEAKISISYGGENYYFCSYDCASKFNTDSEKYLSTSPDKEMMSQQQTMKKNKKHHGCCDKG